MAWTIIVLDGDTEVVRAQCDHLAVDPRVGYTVETAANGATASKINGQRSVAVYGWSGMKRWHHLVQGDERPNRETAHVVEWDGSMSGYDDTEITR